MAVRGRPKSWIQDHVNKYNETEVDSENNIKQKSMATCNYCNQKFRYSTQNLTFHLLSGCLRIPADVRQGLINEHGTWEPPKLKRQKRLMNAVSSINATGSSENSNNNNINTSVSLVPPLTTMEKQNARELLAKAIFDGAIPFDFAENDFFKEFCKVLRPGFIPPTGDTLSHIILPAVKESTQREVESKLAEKGYTWLGVDGSSDNHNSNITHILALTPKPLVLRVYHTGTKKQSSNEIFEQTKLAHQYVSSLHVETDGLLTDNENKMRSVQTQYTQEYSDEDAIGCSSHSLDLVSGDILKHREIAPTVKDSKHLQNKVKNTKLRAFVTDGIRQRDRLTPTRHVGVPMTGATRWNSFKDMSYWQLKNKDIIINLQQQAAAKQYLCASAAIIVANSTFWYNLNIVQGFLEPIACSVDILQGDIGISNVYYQYSKLIRQFDDRQRPINSNSNNINQNSGNHQGRIGSINNNINNNSSNVSGISSNQRVSNNNINNVSMSHNQRSNGNIQGQQASRLNFNSSTNSRAGINTNSNNIHGNSNVRNNNVMNNINTNVNNSNNGGNSNNPSSHNVNNIVSRSIITSNINASGMNSFQRPSTAQRRTTAMRGIRSGFGSRVSGSNQIQSVQLSSQRSQAINVRNNLNNNRNDERNVSRNNTESNINRGNNVPNNGGIRNDNISNNNRNSNIANNNINRNVSNSRIINSAIMRNFIVEKLKLRWKLIRKPIHLAAFIVDPRFRNIAISMNFYNTAAQYLKKKSKDKWTQNEKILTKFRNSEKPFNCEQFNLNLHDDPRDSWKWISMFDEYKGFAKIALRALDAPTGIQGVERSFCSWRRNHTWIRSNLDDTTVEDLVFVYCNLKYLKNFE